MPDTKRQFASALLAMLALLGLGCPTSRDNVRCVIVAAPVKPQADAVPPQLSVMAANPFDSPVRMSVDQGPVRCTGTLKVGSGYYPDDPVDDLTATLAGAGTSDGQPRMLCPAFPTTHTLEKPGIEARPCGAEACENRQYRFESKGVDVHMLFYDDPGHHRLDRVKDFPSGACYYRLYSVSVAWTGKGPQ